MLVEYHSEGTEALRCYNRSGTGAIQETPQDFTEKLAPAWVFMHELWVLWVVKRGKDVPARKESWNRSLEAGSNVQVGR